MEIQTGTEAQAPATGRREQAAPLRKPRVAAVRKRRHPRGAFRYLLFAPSLLLVILFSYYPAVRSIEGSLTDWNGFSPPTFVGLQNFRDYVTSPIFGVEMQNLVLLVGGGTLLAVIFPFLGAELIRALPTRWLPGSVKYLLVIPLAIPQVVLIDVWAYLLNPVNGPVDAALSLFTSSPIQWFSSSHTALLSILLIGFPWVSSLGFLVFLAGLQAIPRELEDAALIDGATSIGRVFRIDIPLSIPQIRFVVVIAGVTMVQNFIPIFLLTNGGPGNATMVPGLDMYTSAFQDNEFGYGMAIGTLLFVAMLVVTVLFFRLLRPRT
ncbi:MAG: carbohydrate ABC transporter permease [Chloroflexota bacterium]